MLLYIQKNIYPRESPMVKYLEKPDIWESLKSIQDIGNNNPKTINTKTTTQLKTDSIKSVLL